MSSRVGLHLFNRIFIVVCPYVCLDVISVCMNSFTTYFFNVWQGQILKTTI